MQTSKDPIRLGGGPNLYAYAYSNPVNATDMTGLDTFMCTAPLHSWPSAYNPSWYNWLYHQFLCVTDSEGNVVCGGQDRTGMPFLWSSPGRPSNDHWPTAGQGSCENLSDSDCVEACIIERINNPAQPRYAIGWFLTDCQEWADNALAECQETCGDR